MDNFLDDLKSNWKQEKPLAVSGTAVSAVLKKAEAYKKSTIRFQYGNVIILSITLIFYVIFFYRFLLYGTLLSKTGFCMMAIPLLVRIIAEIFSIAKGRRIKIDHNAWQHNQEVIRYTSFRKWMHGPVTFTIMGLYTLGYYCIMVEFSELVPLWLIIVLCVAYPVVASFLIFQIRKGIKKEMEQLRWLSAFQTEIKG